LPTACSTLALAACGGGGEQKQPEPPRIQAAVAQPLAERSENVARLLDSGDRCSAAAEAAQLEREVIAAINDRAIPDLYLEDLGSVVHELVAQIPPCEAPPDDDDEKGKGHGKGKGKKKDDDE
jgi:hypothetical protein